MHQAVCMSTDNIFTVCIYTKCDIFNLFDRCPLKFRVLSASRFTTSQTFWYLFSCILASSETVVNFKYLCFIVSICQYSIILSAMDFLIYVVSSVWYWCDRPNANAVLHCSYSFELIINYCCYYFLDLTRHWGSVVPKMLCSSTSQQHVLV